MRTGLRRYLTNDLLSGAFFMAVGVIMAALSRNLPFGTNSQPGSGYLPLIIAVLLCVLGAAIAIRDLSARTRSEAFVAPRARPFLAIVGILGFGGLIEPLGFLISALFLITMALAAYGRIRIVELLGLATFLIAACILIFIVGLGQRIPLLP
jgi:putative tricarboxylic transport membrane protein